MPPPIHPSPPTSKNATTFPAPLNISLWTFVTIIILLLMTNILKILRKKKTELLPDFQTTYGQVHDLKRTKFTLIYMALDKRACNCILSATVKYHFAYTTKLIFRKKQHLKTSLLLLSKNPFKILFN